MMILANILRLRIRIRIRKIAPPPKKNVSAFMNCIRPLERIGFSVKI